MWGFNKKEQEERDKRWAKAGQAPQYVLVCNNSTCGVRIPIGFPRYCQDKCFRCGSPMSCQKVD